MSQVKIALQPPPNVDFVVGYPGIPPAAKDRPQAAVKGAVEVRVGPQGVKAKWVRVELKKIETLPGGGQTNSYFDFVGSSPINLWQSSEEYGLLQSQDLPFHIRIPESIPPSIALERGAGIRYELVATVCTLGKKGFFRRRKTVVTSQATTIIIDKHELHSTWPVYAQAESRSVNQEGVHLTVERQRTCFGPGDRVSVMAILKSDSVHPVIVRGFEFSLKETTIFRASTQSGQTGKRNGPQVKTGLVGEQKVPLNVTLFGGTQHKAELGCLIPNTHTTTTLNAARHIDITYTILVKAWFGSMQAVFIELPVIVSNWPRSVSEEAVRRIGVAPSLCMTPSSTASTALARPLTANSQISDYNSSAQGHGRTPLTPPVSSIKYNTTPNAHNGDIQYDDLEVDEIGALQSHQSRVPGTIDHPGYSSSAQIPMGSIQEDSALVVRPVGGSGRRRRGSAAAGTQNRLTITNISDRDAEVREAVEQAQLAARQQQSTTPSIRGQRSWLSAEEEKRKLYESARAKVEQVQGSAVMAPQSSETSSQQKGSPSFRAAWPTAEEEKIRLFDKAQATAKRTQALGASSHSRDSSEANGSPGLSKPSRSFSALSAGAALYQHAVSSMNKNPNTSPNTSANVSPAPSPPPSTSPKIVPHYPSAEEEKAALKRYQEAKLAVDRSQNTQYATREGISSSSAAPVAYDTLYPSSSISRSMSYDAQPSGSDMPPPFDGPNGQPQYLNEKEKLRRHHEAQDAAAMAAQSPADMSPSYTASPLYSPPAQSSVTSALSEKELLRRKFEEQDGVALAQQQPQPPPPRAVNGSSLPPPPVALGVSGFRPLTAAEEKAQLRAKYAAEEQQANGNVSASASGFIPHHRSPSSTAFSPPPPPPLMPRPPAEYIQETQEEDARVRYYDSISMGTDNSPMRVGSPSAKPGIQLDIRPFTPFSVGLYDPSSPAAQRPPPPPRLPPQN
ncbi:uncharacterized protein F5147DRAFT_224927 [Suillus discolor]|uniref:Arrestin C-terminal-like domain-containing protein n=1 Tax=Suillus discolor TaxID=1912936 RepID=A0A9P7F603_9AGAM|nr:uncharacterized protein F5147DRAFT_224927 [Suillus discolor]KAG2106804.1 hypothetical protein F5147DRAFT_224927 [Suillus discolor]